MKSHDFAKQLMIMGKVLRAGPNVELENLDMSAFGALPSTQATVRAEDIPQTLNMLVGLNNVPKHQWLELIESFGFEIDIRPRDGNRDIYGKLLRYLSDNPTARQRLTGKRDKQQAGVSTELADALTLLLK